MTGLAEAWARARLTDLLLFAALRDAVLEQRVALNAQVTDAVNDDIGILSLL